MACVRWSGLQHRLFSFREASQEARSKGTQAEHVLILRGAVTGVIILGCGHLLRQRVERRSASSCGSKGFGRRWLSGAPVMCADWGGCENKVVLTGVGLGLVATLAAVWCRPAREPAVVDENVKRAVKIVQGLQLNATSRGKAEPARLRHELFGALVKASGSTESAGILPQNLEDHALRQALFDLFPDSVDVPVSRAEFMAGATVAAVLAKGRPHRRSSSDWGESTDFNNMVFELFCAVDSDCDAELSAPEVLAVTSALRNFGLLVQLDGATIADVGSMNITEFRRLCRSRLRLEFDAKADDRAVTAP